MMDGREERPQHDPTPPPTPAVASSYLGGRTPVMEAYVAHLADTGVSHGLIGPREVPRLWERHVLNCTVAAELMPNYADVIDVGSGAGLPGLCLAVARPDLQVTLVEPLLRRVTWLTDVVDDLELPNVRIVRGRAEEQWGVLRADVVTSRAVAALDKLARWSLPLVADGGRMLALKGSSAGEELDAVRPALERWGVESADIVECGAGVVDPPTIVTRLVLSEHPAAGTLARPQSKQGRARSRASSGRSATPPTNRPRRPGPKNAPGRKKRNR